MKNRYREYSAEERAIGTGMDTYIDEAIVTESTDIPSITSRLSTRRDVRLLHAVMGLSGEAGELLDAVKKYVFYGKELDIVNLREEAGDAMWYLAILFSEFGWSFEEVALININKLKIRYPEKFDQFHAIHRLLEHERTALEHTPSINYTGENLADSSTSAPPAGVTPRFIGILAEATAEDFKRSPVDYQLHIVTGEDLDSVARLLLPDVKREHAEADSTFRERVTKVLSQEQAKEGARNFLIQAKHF